MPLNSRRTVTALIAVTLMTAPPTLLASQHEQETEHRIQVDVAPGHEPMVWSYRQGGFLGILMVDLTPELRSHFGVSKDAGVMISSITDESPAAEAGLRVGDIITSIDGESMSGSREVVRAIASKGGGESVTVEVFRDGSYSSLTATLAERERTQFWLNTLGRQGGHLRVMGEGGESVFVLPGPDSELHLQGRAVDEVMEDLHESLTSPEFRGRMMEFRSNTAQLEERIKELEKRLQELSEQLEKIEN
jgi:membrane-associated protease RseP (regulator of RpoE activity)